MFSFFGIGKSRTKLGKWIDKRGITQKEIEEKSGVNKNTLTKLTNDPDHSPNSNTMKKILKVLRDFDPNVNSNDFWDM